LYSIRAGSDYLAEAQPVAGAAMDRWFGKLRPLALAPLVLAFAWAMLPAAAGAADLYAAPAGRPWATPVPIIDPADRWEARFGVFAHGIGSAESDTVDLNGEIATPRLPLGVTGFWSFLVPRIHFGGSLNLSGRTDVLYTGLLWTMPVFDRFFVEGFIGPAIHNGSIVPTATHAGLGCHTLFHVGGSVGYRFNEHWSVQGTFEHLSNGRGIFGIDCGTNQIPGGNQGLNNYGVRVGYAF
jgi:hypothetical protein